MAREIFSTPPTIRRITYLLSVSNHAGIKIGSTHNLGNRLCQFQSPSGRALACQRLECATYSEPTILAEFDGGKRLESLLHAVFRPVRIHGEWFDAELDDIELVAWSIAQVEKEAA